MEATYTTDNVPNGYFNYQNNGHSAIVRVMEIAGKRMVSFMNKDLPVLLRNMPEEAKFAVSPVEEGFKLSPEEIKGRQEELAAYLLEELENNPNLLITRGDGKLYISRADGDKRYHFVLNIGLNMVETKFEDDSDPE